MVGPTTEATILLVDDHPPNLMALEAAILGKPVYTILAPGFERGQQGTLHFKYLLRQEGGCVEVADGFEEHRRHLADAVAGRYDAAQIRRFIEGFIRPAGWERPATPILADAIERLRPSSGSAVVRWFAARRRRPGMDAAGAVK